MLITAADEGLHPAGADEDWQESVYLAWRDPRSGLGGNHRMGNELNRELANLWCGVYSEDGTRFRDNREGLPLQRLEHGIAAGSQRLFHDGSGLRFALHADGCEIEFEIEDDQGSVTSAGSGTFAGSDGAAGQILSDHFNASCRVRGTVELDGRRSVVDALAWRDHSWGARRWASFTSSRSFGGSHGPLQFRFGSMVGANGSFFRRGSMSDAGTPVAVSSARMLVSMDDDSLRCPSAEVEYQLADGSVTTVRIETIGGMLGITRERCGWESVGDVSVDGDAGGWGFLEVNANPRDGRCAPAFALANTMTNGIVRPG